MSKGKGAFEQVGAKVLVICNSAWSDEQWPAFGVEEYPDIEAVHKHAQLLQELNWFRYIDSSTTLGTRWELE